MHSTSDATTDAKIARLSTYQRDGQREMTRETGATTGATRNKNVTVLKCIALPIAPAYTPPRWYVLTIIKYCRSGDIREVLIFANIARRTNSRI